ncbi:MAG: tetratricopeptide repeat protein [Anaerolineales bacterium]|nr:MAG: tetratricopeptide repeat protein [Anaerolineales bacterium]
MAVLYKEQGSYDDAELLLLQALEGRRLKLGDEHPHTLESWHSLAKPPKSCEISGLNFSHD